MTTAGYYTSQLENIQRKLNSPQKTAQQKRNQIKRNDALKLWSPTELTFATTEMCPEKWIKTCSVLEKHERFWLTISFSAFHISSTFLS